MKKKIQTATVAMMAVLTSQALAIAQTPPPSTPAPAYTIDFMALFPAVVAQFGFSLPSVFTGITGAITAVAAIMILPAFSKWGFDQVLCWFGEERTLAKENTPHAKRKRRTEWEEWNIKQYKRREKERKRENYIRYIQKEEMNEQRGIRQGHSDY